MHHLILSHYTGIIYIEVLPHIVSEGLKLGAKDGYTDVPPNETSEGETLYGVLKGAISLLVCKRILH